jgi:hypothetical protein
LSLSAVRRQGRFDFRPRRGIGRPRRGDGGFPSLGLFDLGREFGQRDRQVEVGIAAFDAADGLALV